jgi:hypothetical protein
VHLNEIAMQNATHARREYEMKKIVLTEQERLEAANMELNEAKVAADEDIINARNRQLMQGIDN